MTEKLSVEEYSEKCRYFDENFEEITKNIEAAAKKSGRKPQDIILLAATKTVNVEIINYAIDKGLKFMGENRVQEFLSKEPELKPVHRHFIGHLQTNKVKDIIGKVEMIESVDSLKLAGEISKLSKKCGITTEVLVEINIGEEESKSGVKREDAEEFIRKISVLPNIKVRGLMAIPPICEKEEDVSQYFSQMHNLFVDIRAKNIDNSSMDYLSMGMSSDYVSAIEQGANIVRIGSSLFGKRIYK